MRQVIIIREVGKVLLTETKVSTLALEMEDKKGNWLASDEQGKLHSNNPEAVKASLQKDLHSDNWIEHALAWAYLERMQNEGVHKV